MAKRLMSAIFGITYVVLVLVFNGNLPVLLNISLAAVSAVCVFEVCSAMGDSENIWNGNSGAGVSLYYAFVWLYYFQ